MVRPRSHAQAAEHFGPVSTFGLVERFLHLAFVAWLLIAALSLAGR
jgi:hypothetical protein